MTTLKKWCRYGIIIATGIAIGVLAMLSRRHGRRRSDVVRDIGRSVSDAMQEARQIAEVETTAARNHDIALRERIERVARMSDARVRRESLLALYREVSK